MTNEQLDTELHRLRALNAELLAALKSAMKQYTDLGITQPWFPQARAAIAKAEQS